VAVQRRHGDRADLDVVDRHVQLGRDRRHRIARQPGCQATTTLPDRIVEVGPIGRADAAAADHRDDRREARGDGADPPSPPGTAPPHVPESNGARLSGCADRRARWHCPAPSSSRPDGTAATLAVDSEER
jgi:hypothetical protein